MRTRPFDALSLKLLACTTMFVDHIGVLFYPHQIELRVIGRLAFPLFAFLLAQGVRHTRSSRSYAMRLCIFAIISQLPYSLMLHLAGYDPYKPNIFFTLALGVAVLAFFRRFTQPLHRIAIAIAAILFAEVFSLSYGTYGILLIVAAYLCYSQLAWGITSIVFITIIEGLRPGASWLQLFALASLPFIAGYNGLPGPRLSRWWFYWFYPVHLTALSLISLLSH